MASTGRHRTDRHVDVPSKKRTTEEKKERLVEKEKAEAQPNNKKRIFRKYNTFFDLFMSPSALRRAVIFGNEWYKKIKRNFLYGAYFRPA